MTELHDQLGDTLKRAASQLQDAGLPVEIAARMESLVQEVHHKCTVAVVGRVKAGKSTFINALLGQDLAKTGTTETTATINYFRYGIPLNPDRPVRCYWQDGHYTDETYEFLNSLQDNDVETLRRASCIERMEHYLENPFLREVTLVDTPGTFAVVDEHQDRTAEYLRLRRQLREQHEKETRRWGREADAIIYLVGPVVGATDREFLEEFRDATGGQSQALNALGVMAKIDLHPELVERVERKDNLAAKVARQLESSLNTVVPVSAAIERALDQLLSNQGLVLGDLMRAMQSIVPDQLDKLLSDEGFFLELPESNSIPVSVEERKRLRGDMPWMTFVVIAGVAADRTLNENQVQAKLRSIAGFAPLREVLEQHFFARSRSLKAFKVVTDARQVLDDVRFRHLQERRRRAKEIREQRERFLRFIEEARSDESTAGDLRTFVEAHLTPPGDVDLLLRALEREFAEIYHKLEENNEDFRILQMVYQHRGSFSQSEVDELFGLLGRYGQDTANRLPVEGVSIEYVEQHQLFWRQTSVLDRKSVRREVAERAVWRYGAILDELLAQNRS
jgi:hypothetical protein